MNTTSKLRLRRFAALLLALLAAVSLAACKGGEDGENAETDAVTEEKDYAAAVTLDLNSSSLKQEVTVKSYIDGDTTHFYVPETMVQGGVLKARYLAINTPESTGKIEEWGKKASNFTKEKLSSATSIYIESDDGNLNADSTGSRYLVWVWYKTAASESYRNLNIEILQNGLAIASSSANNRYGSVAMSAIEQAKALKLNIYSGQKDPDFYYGDAAELSLKELRLNTEQYNGVKVAFEGVITRNYNNGVYIEDYDAETDMYYGIYVYYGFSLSGEGLEILEIGNRSRIVGTVQYYEAGGTWQVSGLTYRQMKPDDPGNIKKLSSGNSAANLLTSPDKFANGRVTVAVGDETKTFGYAELAVNSSISMENLTVDSIYTTSNEDSSSYGAMTLSCTAGGQKITVRTAVLYDENSKIITSDAYKGKKINVCGVIDYYDGSYQIKVFLPSDITVVS